MANIKKSFNFRNGVQVDDDNLKVSATGLVGIGTTVPTEALDVRGNLIVSGVSSAVTAQAGVMTVTTLNPTEIIGAGVSIVSGIVTASSGIITFYGDARFLQGMPTSQWEDTNTGLGVSSIYNTGGTVGIATTNPVFAFQVGNDPNSGQSGVGIGSFGDIKVSGVITATSFSGNLDGDITGNISGGTVISGVSTFSDLVDMNSDLDVDGHTNLDNVSVAGVTTFAGIIEGVAGQNKIPALYADLASLPNAGDYHGMFAHVHATGKGYYAHAGNWIELVNKDTSGNVPITGNINVTGGITATGTVQAQQLGASGSLSCDTLNARQATFGGGGGFLSAQNGIAAKNLRLAYGVAGITDSQIMSVSTPLVLGPSPGGQDLNLKGPTLIDGSNPKLNVLGNITINNTSGKVGVGTISPVGDIHVRRYTGDAEIQVTAETGASRVSLGVESGTGQTNHTELRYNLTGQNQFDGTESFSIVNFGKGNFNYMLSAANHNAATGNFFWHKGNGLATTLMTLTNTGRLGIGLTTPTTALHVLGAATVSGTLTIGNNLQVEGTINSDVSGNVTGNLTGNVNGNANAAAGISTFNNLSVSGISTFNTIKATSIGIANDPSLPLTINTNADNRFFVNANGNVGIKTTDTQAMNFMVAGSSVHQILGVGTTEPLSSVDFSLAGQQISGPFANKMFMLPPKITTAQRGNLAGVTNGAIIFVTDAGGGNGKLQVRSGGAWVDLH